MMMMMMMNDDIIGVTGEPQKKFFCIYNIIHLVVIRGFLYGKMDLSLMTEMYVHHHHMND